MRRILAFLIRPAWELMIRHLPVPDPWERLDRQPRMQMYGSGARLDFSQYLKGDSIVPVASLDDVQDWLLECRYEHDEVVFGEPDFWQHPSTFERLRTGDCEDHAIWAWRKLIELGYDVDLVAGWCILEGKLSERHAWLLVRRDGVEYVFEPGAHDKAAMMRPLSEVRDDYVPQFGVDRNAKRFVFAGYILGEQKRLAERPASRRIA